MAKGDDLWGDQPALGPGSQFGGRSEDPPADLPAKTPDNVPAPADPPLTASDDAPAAAPTRLDIEGDRIDGMGKIDLAKKQAFELTAIRLLLERLSDQIDEAKTATVAEPSEANSKTQP